MGGRRYRCFLRERQNASAHSVMESHLRNLLFCQTYDSVAKNIHAAVDFVKQSCKKEGKCFGKRSYCHRLTWALGRRRLIVIVIPT